MEKILKHKLKKGIFFNVSPLRSKMMSSIRGKHNKSTELRLRMALVKAGIRGWILHPNEMFGNPDIFFVKKKLAIFVDGCFWHGCGSCGHIPKTRPAFWKAKIERNQERANIVKVKLRQKSIKVMRVWEHVLKDPQKLEKFIKTILVYKLPIKKGQCLWKRSKRSLKK